MHFFQLVAAWMFPCAVCASTTMAPTVATAATTDGASSPALSPGGVKVASPSSRSSTSVSLLGARSSLSNSARSPVREGGATAAPKGHAVRRCLRKFARKLQRAVGTDERPDGRRRRKSRAKKPDGRATASVDGTACEREEAVASAIAYCKETSRQRCTPPLPLSPSLDGLLNDRPEEEISTTKSASHCECEGQGNSSAAVPHDVYAACGAGDAECGGCSPSTAETPCCGRGAAKVRRHRRA